MKNLIFSIFLLALMTQCTTYTFFPVKGAHLYGYDLSEYSREEFLITPHEYQGKFLVTSIFTQELVPEIRWNEKTAFTRDVAEELPIIEGFIRTYVSASSGTSSAGSLNFVYVIYIEDLNPEDAIKKAVDFVQSSGGNGIMDFKITKEEGTGMIKSMQYKYPVIKIEGVGIKRRE